MLRSKEDVIDAILDAVDDSGSVALQDLYSAVADRLSLSGTELTERASNGMLAYEDQVSWVLTSLIQDGTLHRPERAVYARFDGPRIRLRDLTDRRAIDDSIDEFDRIGREAFLEKYGFDEARDYFVVSDDGRYDSKAIFAAAWLREHGSILTPMHFHGGRRGAGGRLVELGYTVEDGDSQRLPMRAPSSASKPIVHVSVQQHCPSCGLALPASKVCDFC